MSTALDSTEDDVVVVLPWHRNPINLVALALALVVLAAAAGFVIGNNRALVDPNDTDVGFLQDMRVHHEQAVQMSLIYLDSAAVGTNSAPDRQLATIAREILVGQNIEIGRMIQLLRGFGESEINDSDLAMGWMGHPIEANQMPGLATETDLIALAEADGVEADAIFVELMTAHHRGGIDMADLAATQAATDEVRRMAQQMADGQRDEIIEMGRLLARSDG